MKKLTKHVMIDKLEEYLFYYNKLEKSLLAAGTKEDHNSIRSIKAKKEIIFNLYKFVSDYDN